VFSLGKKRARGKGEPPGQSRPDYSSETFRNGEGRREAAAFHYQGIFPNRPLVWGKRGEIDKTYLRGLIHKDFQRQTVSHDSKGPLSFPLKRGVHWDLKRETGNEALSRGGEKIEIRWKGIDQQLQSLGGENIVASLSASVAESLGVLIQFERETIPNW